MKKLFSILAIATATLFAVSCSSEYDDTAVWDELGKHNERISKLETLCGQMNTNISSLQAIVTALQNNDYVTGVAPITQNGVEIGYTISFSKSGSITIYHGKDGKDGVNGADGKDGINGTDGVNGTNGIDGTTPIIGVKQDTDGIYYWTVNGEWLLDDVGNKIKAVGTDGQDGTNGADGADGKDGVDGTNGTDGKDGVNGTNGTDGITPQLKIENDYWYISYDNGASWTQIGKAKGEDGQDGANGADGAAGKDGDSFFQSVTQDENNVIFTLIDGTVLTLPKSSSYLFNKLQSVSYIPRYEDGKATVFYSTADNSQVEMDFEVSPKDAAAEIAAQWETILSLKAVNTQTRAITYIDMPISGCTADTEKGIITVTASGNNLSEDFFAGTQPASARLGISDGNTNITSDFISLVAQYKQPNNEIWYTSTDGNIVEPHRTYVFGANIISNIYENGKGVILFDSAVTTIGNSSFSGCKSLASFTIPDSVTKIGVNAFFSCSGLTSITIPNSVTSIGGSAFSYCYGLTSITIPNSVTSIGGRAFYGCSGLTSITIPDGVTSIGNHAFSDCTGLTSVTIPDSVTKIGDAAFYNCDGLTSITIPDGVTSIGCSAFGNCSSLTSVTIPNSVTQIDINPFENCENLAEFKGKFASEDGRCLIVDGVLKSFAPAGLTEYTIPNSVTEIGNKAFWSCVGLINITIGNSVTKIADNPFYWCINLAEFKGKFATEDGRCLIIDGVLKSFASTRLTEYTIPNSVTEIGDYAFYGCSNLTNITIPSGVIEIGFRAFSTCHGFTNIIIPDSVTKIGNYAFYDCSGLTSITIPDSIIEIGNYTFAYCTSLTSVFCERTTPPAAANSYWGAFNKNAADRKIYVPRASVDAYKAADGWKEYADSIEPYDFSAVSE